MTPNSSVMLGEATVQQIQLELMQRASFNAFDGARVVGDLVEHAHLWQAALMTRMGQSLITLRDLHENHWSADTLLLLAADPDAAASLADLASGWAADSVDLWSKDRTGQYLGTSDPGERRVVCCWWD